MNAIRTVVAVAVGAIVWPRAAAARENLLKNPSFEFPAIQGQVELDKLPSAWNPFATDPKKVPITLTTMIAKDARQSARFTSPGEAGSYCGIYQTLFVQPGEVYEFQIYVRMDKHQSIRGTQWGEMRVEFRNMKDEEIGRIPGPQWTKSLSPNKWTKNEMQVVVPEDATQARFVISENDGLNPIGQGQSFLVDKTSVEKKR